MVLCKGGRLGAQIDKVKSTFYMDLHGWYEIWFNAFYMDLHGWYEIWFNTFYMDLHGLHEIWFNGKIKNITILNKFLILK